MLHAIHVACNYATFVVLIYVKHTLKQPYSKHPPLDLYLLFILAIAKSVVNFYLQIYIPSFINHFQIAPFDWDTLCASLVDWMPIFAMIVIAFRLHYTLHHCMVIYVDPRVYYFTCVYVCIKDKYQCERFLTIVGWMKLKGIILKYPF